MKVKVLAVALALSTFTVSAFAEQPAAQKYRDILQSGKFYVEYELDYATKGLAVDSGKRMDYTMYKKNSSALGLGLSLINPVLALGALFGKSSSKVPTAYYDGSKFYQFEGKKEAVVATEEQLSDVNIDPSKGWSSVKDRLALPEELAVFAPKDQFFVPINGATDVRFVESGEKADGEKKIPFDKYMYDVKSRNGKTLYSVVYYMYYKEGELKKIESYVVEDGQEEKLLQNLKVKKITGELPKNVLQMPKGCKVYAVGIGDMNDLLEQPTLVETY